MFLYPTDSQASEPGYHNHPRHRDRPGLTEISSACFLSPLLIGDAGPGPGATILWRYTERDRPCPW
jgi:hypothetical protein